MTMSSDSSCCGAKFRTKESSIIQCHNNTVMKISPIGKPLDTDPGTLDPRALTAVTLTVRI